MCEPTDNAVDYIGSNIDDDAIITWISEFGHTHEYHNATEPYTMDIINDTPSVKNESEDGEGGEEEEETEVIPVSLSTDVRLDPEDIAILRYVLGWCTETVIVSELKAVCYGCSVNHPSQRQHTCLDEPDAYHFERCYNDICAKLFKPSLTNALDYALKELRGKTVSELRILGAADAIVSEWQSEPYIIDKLREIRESVLRYKIHPTMIQCSNLWSADCSVYTTDDVI